MMDPKDLKKLLFQLQRIMLNQKRTALDTKFQISMLFTDAMECADYRIPKAPIVLDSEGHEFKCPKCGTVFDSPESNVSEYDLCYVCGQLWKEHGTIMEELHGNEDINHGKKHEYGRKKKWKRK